MDKGIRFQRNCSAASLESGNKWIRGYVSKETVVLHQLGVETNG